MFPSYGLLRAAFSSLERESSFHFLEYTCLIECHYQYLRVLSILRLYLSWWQPILPEFVMSRQYLSKSNEFNAHSGFLFLKRELQPTNESRRECSCQLSYFHAYILIIYLPWIDQGCNLNCLFFYNQQAQQYLVLCVTRDWLLYAFIIAPVTFWEFASFTTTCNP